MEDKYISQYTHEAEQARLERIIKRLWILAIIEFITLVVVCVTIVHYESQWEVVEETTEQTVTQDVRATGDSDAVLAGIGDATNGSESEADGEAEDDSQIPQKEETVDD